MIGFIREHTRFPELDGDFRGLPQGDGDEAEEFGEGVDEEVGAGGEEP
jgi:hypothetical protein